MISDDDDDSFISDTDSEGGCRGTNADDGDSFISNTESEGGFGGANADDNGSDGAIPFEGAQGNNFAVDGEGIAGLHAELTQLIG